jgi:DNA-binding XRE family transcriptional regulator
MINLLDPNTPTLDDIVGMRHNAKITQQQAADLIGYSRRGWQDAENGKTKMHPAAWALFLLATGQHPSHQVMLSNIQ